MLFKQNWHFAPHHTVLSRPLLFGQKRLQFLQTGICNLRRNICTLGCGRAGTRGIFEGIGLSVIHFAHQIHRLREVFICLAGEAHDEIP